jgi:hypothetical protein
LRIRWRGAIVARTGMNARLVEASVLLGASALTVWLFLCARWCAEADVRRGLLEAKGGHRLWDAAIAAQRRPEAWIHDEAACEAVMQHLRRDPYSRRCCLWLGPNLHAHRPEIWEMLCAEIQSTSEDRAYDALMVLPRMGGPVPEPIVDDLWNWCVRLDRSNSGLRFLVELFVAGIESTAAGKQMLLRKWQAASYAERLQLVALGILDPERRWQPAAK